MGASRAAAVSAIVTLYVLLALLHAAVKDVKPISLTVYPAVSFAPAVLVVRVRVHPKLDEDRWIRVVLDSGEFYRSSEFSITTDQPLYTWRLTDLPGGDYVGRADLGHGEIIRATDRTTVQIVAR